jgi:hypothetical protein
MSLQTWNECLITAQVAGAAVTNTVTATSIIGSTGTGASQAKYTFPTNYFYIGRHIRIFAMGSISTLTASPGTLTLDVRFGSTVVANGGAMALNTTAQTNVPWTLEWNLTCRAIGSGTLTTFMPIGRWTSPAIIGAPAVSAGGTPSFLIPSSAPGVGTGFDVTATQTVDMFATWSTASSSNSITLQMYTMQSIN